MDCEFTGEDWSMEAGPAYQMVAAYQEKMALLMAERSELFPDGKLPTLPWGDNEQGALLDKVMGVSADNLVVFSLSTYSRTVALIRHHLKTAQGIEVSVATVRRCLEVMGYRWKRPRYVVVGLQFCQ
jgi:hypothetical protein